LIIDTKRGFEFSGFVSIRFSEENGCAKLNKPIRVPINVIVCGNEKLKVDNREIDIKFEIGKTKNKDFRYE